MKRSFPPFQEISWIILLSHALANNLRKQHAVADEIGGEGKGQAGVNLTRGRIGCRPHFTNNFPKYLNGH
jgi:hypothetical protein